MSTPRKAPEGAKPASINFHMRQVEEAHQKLAEAQSALRIAIGQLRRRLSQESGK